MDKAQNIRDRKMRRMRSSSWANEDYIRRTKRAKSIIEDLEHHGPAGLIHIAVLSNIIGKSIKIWNADSSLNSIIGKEKIGPSINIEYHANDLGGIGHWTLMQAKDPDNTQIDLNSCLFSVIGSQTGLSPSELRRWTMLSLKGNARQLADWLDKILRLEGTNSDMVLMIGGARYCGTSSVDAGVVLDNSQNAKSYDSNILGHPRGHVIDPTATGAEDSVERYSMSTGEPKTAFLSQNDQNTVVHLALTTSHAQYAIEKLNQGSKDESLELESTILRSNGRFNFKGQLFKQGQPIGPELNIKEVVLVLRHHAQHYLERNVDVLIHTCYPRI
ncbi:uncharacterized protein LOC116843298 [Odontomachus brunneus]|uniref:uncharacterized protein LOC116843298 n=1 Tax=Odontomachus brunneus TaxID=486640 RepID=UPI0013F27A03|nr:uncharacterized protein LOC116843298 [Odontomachus brunneus]